MSCTNLISRSKGGSFLNGRTRGFAGPVNMQLQGAGNRFLHLFSITFTLVLHHGAENTMSQEGGLRAGAALSNITPKMGVPLDGTIMQIGPATHVHDELWARCLVLDNGTTKLAFAQVDSTMISKEIHDEAKRQIMESTGIPGDHVCIAATHTHSTPRAVIGLKDDALHREYLEYLAVKIADGVKRATNNLAPAEIGWGSFPAPEYVFNRRWWMKKSVAGPFGAKEMVRMNPGSQHPDLVEPSGPVDDEFFVVALRHRESKSPLALMGNYGLHYIGGIPRGQVSADYFGVFSDLVQEAWTADRLSPPFVAMLSNGASGDINAIDMTRPRKKYKAFEQMTAVAADLAARAVALLDDFSFGNDIELGAQSSELMLNVRKPDRERLNWARRNAAQENTRFRLTRPQIYAREVLELADFPDAIPVPLQAFRIGQLAIAQSPCETFAETGLKIKESSPFGGSTFLIELANGYNGYLPPLDQFELGGYETWPARSSYLEEGAEEQIREKLLDLLDRLHN